VWTYTIKDGARVESFDTFGPSIRRRVDEKLADIVGLLAHRSLHRPLEPPDPALGDVSVE
jgi:hypothetical protein